MILSGKETGTVVQFKYFIFPVGTFCFCSGLTLAGCQVPAKSALSLPSSTGQESENTMNGSR